MDSTFTPGTVVIYGLHGRCQVTSIEDKKIGTETQSYYRLEVLKAGVARTQKRDGAIWIPTGAAKDRGLRLPLLATETEAVFQVLSSREYYFNLQEPWASVHPKLEATVRSEGAIGLAKAFSYLTVLSRRQIVPQPEISRTLENIAKALLRELSDATSESIKALEPKIEKMIRPKLLMDH